MSRKRINKLPKSNQQITTTNKAFRADGWGNLINNLGTRNSRSGSTTYNLSPKLDRMTLINMYTNDAIARQVVNLMVDDAMRGFINADELLLDELKRINSKQKITDAATWGRLYGGCALVAFADDGQDMENPLNLERLRKVVSLQVYDRYQISSMPQDINQDYYSEHYGYPEVYTINSVNGTSFRVHRTRMHLFVGEKTPEIVDQNNRIWNDSVLQSCYEALKNLGQSTNATAEILQDYIQTIISVNGLTELIRSGNEDEIERRMQIIDMTRTVSNTVFLDAEGETYSKHASNTGGLTDILEKFQENVCASSKYTMTRLFGITSKGLGNSGNNDSDNLNNTIEAYRCDAIEPCFTWLIDMLEAQSEWVNKPESFNWTFPSLKTSDEHETAKNRLMAAQTDQIYIDRGGVSAEFMFRKRYSNGGFQTDIFISEDEMNEIEGDNELGSDDELNLKDVTEIQRQLSIESQPVVNIDLAQEREDARQAIEHESFKRAMDHEEAKQVIELKIMQEEFKLKKQALKLIKDINNG